jgi:hypothetical protein
MGAMTPTKTGKQANYKEPPRGDAKLAARWAEQMAEKRRRREAARRWTAHRPLHYACAAVALLTDDQQRTHTQIDGLIGPPKLQSGPHPETRLSSVAKAAQCFGKRGPRRPDRPGRRLSQAKYYGGPNVAIVFQCNARVTDTLRQSF